MRLAASSTAVKIFASVVLVGGAASVAGLGTFGAFTSTTTASESVTSGKVVLSSAAGAVSMATPVADMVPGDVAQRAVTLSRSTDTTSFGSVKLTTTASTSNALTSGVVANGLTMKIDQCSVAWTKAATTNDLTCTGGTTTSVVAQRAVIGADLDLAAATTTLNASGATSFLRVSVSLPAAADNTFQGLSNTLTFTFDGTQRAANTAL
jgi:predicted ribosomally synthesized peptide with SipW-like signal peptide